MIIQQKQVSGKFRYLWLKKVTGVLLSYHCATCLRGTYCQHACKATVHREYAKLDANSEPIVVFLKDEGNNNGRC